MLVRVVTHIEMCSFLHGSTFSQCLRYRRGSPVVDPKPGGKERPLQKPNVCTPRLFVCDNFEQSPGHRMGGYGDAGHRLFVLRLSKALRGHVAPQSSQLVEMKTEVNHHGTTAEKRITAALRWTRVY